MADINTQALEILGGAQTTPPDQETQIGVETDPVAQSVETPIVDDINEKALNIFSAAGGLNRETKEAPEEREEIRAGSNLMSRAAVAGITMPEEEIEEQPIIQEAIERRLPKLEEAVANQYNPEGLLGFIKKSAVEQLPIPLQLVHSFISGKDAPIETQTQVVGQVAGGIGEVLFSKLGQLAGKIMPPELKDALSVVGGEIAKTEAFQGGLELLQSGMEEYQQFADQNPRIARDIEGAIGLTEIIGTGEIITGGKKLLQKGFSGLKGGLKGSGTVAKFETAPVVAGVTEVATETVSTGAKKTALDMLKPTGKKAEQIALKEGRVITPKSKLQKFLFGEEVTPSRFQDEASDFIAEHIPNVSSSRSKAIQQISNTIDKIDESVTTRAKKMKAPKKTLKGVEDSFLQKADDIATDFGKPLDDRGIQKYVNQFNENIKELRATISKKGGNLGDLREARKKWDKSFDPAIRKISPDEIVGKPNSTQIKWRMWKDGRNELNTRFFESAAEQGDELMKKSLKDMSLGINSIDEIAKNGSVAQDIIRRHKRKIITAGLTALGLGVLR